MDAVEVVESLRRQPVFNEFLGLVNDGIKGSIVDYIRARSVQELRPTPKAIKDAVWGMIDVTEPEAFVLDSPPLQRLRHVRQLGVTFLTYPTAGYSRFEHALGAMHQARRMLVAIQARSEHADDLLDNAPTVRLAALLHDVGHLPFSHVCERYYERECGDKALCESIRRLKLEIVNALSARQPRLSECLSLLLALTPAFGELLGPNGARYTPQQISEAVLSIVGRPPSAERAFLAQIITNVIDADKLDYMFRDAFCTGVPLAVDLERLLFKLRCISVEMKDCPEAFRNMFPEQGVARVLGTDLTGQRHAHDLALSRAMLFERVYHHHKTLAAERVVLRMLDNLRLHPTALLQEDDRFFSRYAEPKHPENNHPMLAMLDLRRLPHRAFAISYAFLQDCARAEKNGLKIPEPMLDAWQDLESMINDPARRAAFESQILDEASRIGSILGTDVRQLQIWVDTAPASFELPEVDIRIERPDGSFARGSSFPADAAAFAHNPRAMSYVYADGVGQVGRECVFLATELLLARDFGLVLGRAAADYAKINWQGVQRDKRSVERADGSYYSATRAIRPTSAAVRTPGSSARIRTLADRFAHYGIASHIVVNWRRIVAFLDQFPEELTEPMLRVIERITFLDRTELGRGFATVIGAAMAAGGQCVPLSKELFKSAAHVGYFLVDSADSPKPTTLDEALKHAGEITFFDDCLLSGKQARTVVQTWFGLEKDLDEDLADELTIEQQGALRERKPSFRFLYATEEGLANFKNQMTAVGLEANLTAATIVPLGQKPLDAILSPDEAKDLRTFLTGIGKELLKTKHLTAPEKWTTARCEEYALGYGGFEQLLVLVYNTPTATITALWKGGIVGGIPWLPLFPRRGEESPEITP